MCINSNPLFSRVQKNKEKFCHMILKRVVSLSPAMTPFNIIVTHQGKETEKLKMKF